MVSHNTRPVSNPAPDDLDLIAAHMLIPIDLMAGSLHNASYFLLPNMHIAVTQQVYDGGSCLVTDASTHDGCLVIPYRLLDGNRASRWLAK